MRRARCGITMIELLVSVMVLGLALLPVFDLLTRGVRQERVSRDQTMAVVMGSELLDQIQCMPFSDLQAIRDQAIKNTDDGKNLIEGKDATMLVITPASDTWSRTLSIVEPSEYLRKITVTVKWTGEMSHEVKLSTFMEYAP